MIELPVEKISVVVLGNMQDGGLPHAGCRCPRCRAAFANPAQAGYVASLGIVDRRGEETAVWLVDATPDIKYQLNLLAEALGPHPSRPQRLRQPDGLFLTHAHMGHISGLPQLGPEAMAVEKLPVYGAPGLMALLQMSELWQPLTENLSFIPLTSIEPVILGSGLQITPLPVPHRDEWGTGTFGFHVQGPSKSLLYVPDIDTWEQWPQAQERLAEVDYALVDATFYSEDEWNGRPAVAHPLIPHTLDLFAHLPNQLILTHFNHTNPVLDKGSKERENVLAAGATLAQTGQIFTL